MKYISCLLEWFTQEFTKEQLEKLKKKLDIVNDAIVNMSVRSALWLPYK